MLLKNIINYEERKRLHQENGQRTELLHNDSPISTIGESGTRWLILEVGIARNPRKLVGYQGTFTGFL